MAGLYFEEFGIGHTSEHNGRDQHDVMICRTVRGALMQGKPA